MSPLKLLARTPVLGLVRGPGKHREKTASTRTPIFPPAAQSTGVVAHGFRHCLTCTTETVAILHPKGGHTCGDCGREHYAEGGAE
ncbi:hypothetical protein AB0H77_15505 [Streptomyces sp. NPDC050844]|uniref:hypothetical protein n=1 Tax=Streptomyces sp. NPDC050844 TaxID=3155790 RepID=UPI00340EA85B